MEMLHVRIPKGIHKALKLYAVSNGKSITSIVGDILSKFLEDKRELIA